MKKSVLKRQFYINHGATLIQATKVQTKPPTGTKSIYKNNENSIHPVRSYAQTLDQELK